jgi:hypothetical protein
MRFSQVAFSVTLLLAASVSALPSRRAAAASASFHLSNGQQAQALNAQFQNLTADSPCQAGEEACVGGDLGQCVAGKFATTPCAADLKCFALPLDNKPGTRYVTHHRHSSHGSERGNFDSLLANISTTALRVIPKQMRYRVSRAPVPQVA